MPRPNVPERTLFEAMLALHEATTEELVAALRSRVAGDRAPSLALAHQLVEVATQAVTEAERMLPR